MNLVSRVSPKDFIEALHQFSTSFPDVENYDLLIDPNRYYLFQHDNKLEAKRGDAAPPGYRKLSLSEIVKLAHAFINSLESPRDIQNFRFFALHVRDHVRFSKTVLLDSISLIDRIDARIKIKAAKEVQKDLPLLYTRQPLA